MDFHINYRGYSCAGSIRKLVISKVCKSERERICSVIEHVILKTMKKKQMIRKLFIIILCIFLVSILFANIIIPAAHKKTNLDYQNEISKTEFETDAVSSERVRCIDDNEEALLWRLRMIGSAEKSIIMATFDLRADESGKDVMSALYHAAEKGVKVQLLIDGIYQLLFLKDSDTFQALCPHDNIEVRFYNPVNIGNIYKVNYRMHDKYLMIDDKMYLLDIIVTATSAQALLLKAGWIKPGAFYSHIGGWEDDEEFIHENVLTY